VYHITFLRKYPIKHRARYFESKHAAMNCAVRWCEKNFIVKTNRTYAYSATIYEDGIYVTEINSEGLFMDGLGTLF
jgi:hypothetical protein